MVLVTTYLSIPTLSDHVAALDHIGLRQSTPVLRILLAALPLMLDYDMYPLTWGAGGLPRRESDVDVLGILRRQVRDNNRRLDVRQFIDCVLLVDV